MTTVNNGAVFYTYDAMGQRVRKDSGRSWTVYVYFNGQLLTEKNSDGIWSDYISANGTRLARAGSVMLALSSRDLCCWNDLWDSK